MNRFEIIDSEAGKENLRELLQSRGLRREWQCSLKVGDREEGWEIWARKPRPQIIPWLEVNQHDAVSDAVYGLRFWQKITDTAIVTTVPYCRLYDGICSAVPGMRIVPGVKTDAALASFHDLAGWGLIAKELAGMAEVTGSSIVALENESAVEKYRLGREAINWDQFRKCLAQLPRDLTIWLYPAMAGENEAEQTRMGMLSSAVAGVCDNVVLLDHQSCGGPRGLTYSWSTKGRERLDAIVAAVPDASILRMLYFYGPGSKGWMDEQVFEALAATGDDQVIIYPGAVRFKRVAELFVAALGAVPGGRSKTISGDSR